MALLTLLAAAHLAFGSAPSFLQQVGDLIQSDPAQAESLIRSRFKKEDLVAGVAPMKEGTRVLFAVEAKSGASVSGDNLPPTALIKVGNLCAVVANLRSGLGSTVRYTVDGTILNRSFNLEVYDPNPFVETPPGGRKGDLRDMGELQCLAYPGTIRHWWVYLPPDLDSKVEYPVLFGCDAQWDREWQANSIENAVRAGLIRPTVGIFIEPGQDKPGNYSNRSFEYDRLTADYSNFLLKEIEPQVAKLVKLSRDPAMRACVGISSGGICSFTSCWQHPESFGVMISGVGSFDDIAHGESLIEGGHNYPFLVRLSEKKPIRAFLQDGSHDLDNQFGNWWLGNQQMAASLKFKGYDYQWYPGEGFHSSEGLRSVFDKALAWWQGVK